MSIWLSRVREGLSGRAAMDPRRGLQQAQRSRARLDLEPIRAPSRCPLGTTVEEVLESGFIVARPMRGGAVRPIGRYEHYRLSFIAPEGRVSGTTQALGRARISSGSGAALYGYRMALPEDLRVVDPRRALMTLLGPEAAPEAELRVLGRRGPILGVVEDLDAGGARIVCRNGGDQLHRGQNASFNLALPEPLGLVHEAVRVTEIERTDGQAPVRVRLAFRTRNEAIAEALRKTR